MAGSAAQRTMERMGNLDGAGFMGDIAHSLEQRLCGEAARRGIGVVFPLVAEKIGKFAACPQMRLNSPCPPACVSPKVKREISRPSVVARNNVRYSHPRRSGRTCGLHHRKYFFWSMPSALRGGAELSTNLEHERGTKFEAVNSMMRRDCLLFC